jgi:hypothetical protein
MNTVAGLVLTTPLLFTTLRLKASTVSAGTIGATNVGVAVLAPFSVTAIPAVCTHE